VKLVLPPGESVDCAALCAVPDGPLLVATGSRDGTVRIWDGQTGRQLRSIQIEERFPIRTVTWNPDGEHVLLAVQSGFSISIWA
jgi:WD40 repeat protein